MKFKIAIFITLAVVSILFSLDYSEDIRLNQIGFYPENPKLAIAVETEANQFFIASPDLKDTLFTGNLGPLKNWSYSEENVKQADFSEFQTIGSYIVVVPDIGYSNAFDIKPRVHQEIARGAIKSYYFTRMSIDLLEEYAGDWARPMGHPDTNVLVHASAATTERPESTVISSPRGWYDAGDYNKYIVNSGISTYTMLAIYEHFPEYARALDLNIPESGNTVPDVLDECLWNIRWMLTMQDPNDGGVYHKCTHANFSGTVMPNQATAPRYVVQKSSTATLDFAAVMAQTSRIFREFETEYSGFADSCLTAAVAAWNWARKNPDTFYRQNNMNSIYDPDITTGEYGDSNDDDEFKWAAAELYITTLQDSFIQAENPLINNSPRVPGWNGVGTLGLYSLAHHRKHLTAAIDTTVLKQRLINLADDVKAEIERSAYGVMMRNFGWGSNGTAANQSMAMLQAFNLSGNPEYLDATVANLDYLLGRNATTYCFVSGYGEKPPMHFHHRPSEADDVVDPIPGLLAGGPNPHQQDNCSGYPSSLPAVSYTDTYCSYASNETCINWNAPLAYASAGVEALLSASGKPNTISIQLAAPLQNQAFSTDDQILLSADADISEGEITTVEFFTDDVKIGEAAAPPFEITWDAALAGVYHVRAKATGDQGDFAYSAPVTIVVNSAEPVGNVLMIVGSLNLGQGDEAIFKHLLANDYQISIQDDDSLNYPVADKDLLLISSTVLRTRNIRDELLNTEIPTISWELLLLDDYGWTGRFRDTDVGLAISTDIDVINDSHPISVGVGGTTQIYKTPQEFVWGVPNENAEIIATLSADADKAAIYSYEVDAVMMNGKKAMSRRIGFCLSDDAASDFTDAGWQLFMQAVEWAQNGKGMAVQDDEQPQVITAHQLLQNYPNPFNPETRISYLLKEQTHVSISIYNAVGQLIAVLIDQPQSAGSYHVVWDGRDSTGITAGSGIYFYKMQADDFEQIRKMMFLK